MPIPLLSIACTSAISISASLRTIFRMCSTLLENWSLSNFRKKNKAEVEAMGSSSK